MTAVGLSSAETAAPSEVVIEEARRGISAAAEIKVCPLREAAVGVVVVLAAGAAEAAAVAGAAAVEAVGAEVVVEAVEELAEAAAVGNLPGTTHPLSKGGKSHGAIR